MNFFFLIGEKLIQLEVNYMASKKKNKDAKKKEMYEFANDQLGENKDPSYNPLNNKEKKSKKK
jgi:hypothetical protein